MIGSVRWNIYIGLMGFILTFLFSFSNNVFLTTFIRSFYCFVILFLFAFLVRWVLGTLIGLKELGLFEGTDNGEDYLKGTVVDYITPDERHPEDHLHLDTESTEYDQSTNFSPIEPPKLTKNLNHPAEDIAQAIRKVTEE